MRRVQRLLRSFDRVQQRSRWLGFPFAVMGKFRDDHGGALTTVIAYNAFFAFFPLLLVVVTVLGFLLGRDSGFQQRLLGSAVDAYPIATRYTSFWLPVGQSGAASSPMRLTCSSWIRLSPW